MIDIKKTLRFIGTYQIFFVWSWTLGLNRNKLLEGWGWVVWVAVVALSTFIFGKCHHD